MFFTVEDSRKWFNSLSTGSMTLSFHSLSLCFSAACLPARPPLRSPSLTSNENRWPGCGCRPARYQEACRDLSRHGRAHTTSGSLERMYASWRHFKARAQARSTGSVDNRCLYTLKMLITFCLNPRKAQCGTILLIPAGHMKASVMLRGSIVNRSPHYV